MTNANYNIGVGAAGVDPTQHNRQMGAGERTARVIGGVVGAASVSRGLGGAKSAGTAMEAEAVTAEGVKVRVPHTDEPTVSAQAEMRGIEQGRRNVEMHEATPANPKLGHTMEKHVGKSETWLRRRLETDPDIGDFASSFRNEAAANRVQGQFVKQNRAKIDEWLASGEETFRGKVAMNDPIGIVVERGKGSAVETNKAFVMLERDNSSQGWHYLTSYPIK